MRIIGQIPLVLRIPPSTRNDLHQSFKRVALQESLRVLAVLASPVCPLQQEVLRQPLLGRILAFVRAQYRVRKLGPPSCHLPYAAPSGMAPWLIPCSASLWSVTTLHSR